MDYYIFDDSVDFIYNLELLIYLKCKLSFVYDSFYCWLFFLGIWVCKIKLEICQEVKISLLLEVSYFLNIL